MDKAVSFIPEPSEKATIACCECGTPIKSNPANMCVTCLRARVDITEGIPKQYTLIFCRSCERYLQPPSEWLKCPLESRELLSLCLKRLKGMNRVKLADANFEYTEPHSKRIKVRLTIQGEVARGTLLEQIFIVEFIVNHQMCSDCHRTEAKDFWNAVVQVRQKSQNKKTFLYLEQLILKAKAERNILGLIALADGMDFYYANEAHCIKMVDFLGAHLPCKYQTSKKLISHDIHSNVYNYKCTYSVDIVPVSKDSVVCISKQLSQHLGGISQLCLVYRVTQTLHLIDPKTAQVAEVNSNLYWRNAFSSIFNPKQLVEYTVMDIDPILYKDRVTFPGQGRISQKHVLADVLLEKSSEIGLNQGQIHTRTHLGHVLKIGDTVLGYNIQDSNVNNTNFDNLNKENIPDVIIVKKYYPERAARRRYRNWKLKRMNEELMTQVEPDDYNEFLDDLEDDPVLREKVNIYKDTTKDIYVAPNDEEAPYCISLADMLEDMDINDDVEMEGA